jgi:hypothetical protein
LKKGQQPNTQKIGWLIETHKMQYHLDFELAKSYELRGLGSMLSVTSLLNRRDRQGAAEMWVILCTISRLW